MWHTKDAHNIFVSLKTASQLLRRRRRRLNPASLNRPGSGAAEKCGHCEIVDHTLPEVGNFERKIGALSLSFSAATAAPNFRGPGRDHPVGSRKEASEFPLDEQHIRENRQIIRSSRCGPVLRVPGAPPSSVLPSSR